MSLTQGAIARINNAEKGVFRLQVTAIKPVLASGVPNRYRLLLSDGAQTIPGMLSAAHNHLITNNNIIENCIIEVTDFMKNEISNQTVVILLNLSVVGMGGAISGGGLPPTVPSVQVGNPYASVQQQQQQQSSYGGYQAPPSNNNPYMQQATPTPSTAYNNPYGASASNSRPIVRDSMGGSNTQYMPINALNPYANRWTIKARVTSKSDMRRWTNAKGEGNLFSIDLLDTIGGEIRGTFFKEDADKFFPILEEGKVYTFSGGKLKIANKQYTTIKNNYEITFDRQTDIQPCADESDIKAASYNFVKIGDLVHVEANSLVDIICIVKSAGEISEISLKNQGGKTLQKKELIVIDDSETEVRLTLWGEKAMNNSYGWADSPIVAFKNVKVSDFNGRSVGCTSGTNIQINPEEGRALHEWRSKFSSQGLALPSHSISGATATATQGMDPLMSRKSVASIKDETLGMGEKPDYFTLKASVSFIKREPDPWYTACPSADCNKKVIESMNGQWQCEKCNKSYDECRRRYMLSIVLQDTTGTNWFSAFDDTANKFLGKSADTLYSMKASGDQSGYDQAFNNGCFKTYLVKVRSKQETYQDESRVKSQILSVSNIDYVDESRQLIEAIQKYN